MSDIKNRTAYNYNHKDRQVDSDFGIPAPNSPVKAVSTLEQ